MKKKMISVLTVTGLIFLVLAAGIITMFVKRYAPSKEMMDQKEYFGLTQDDQAALVVNNELKEEKKKPTKEKSRQFTKEQPIIKAPKLKQR